MKILKLLGLLGALAFSGTAAAGTLDIQPSDCAAADADYVLGTTCWTTDVNSQPTSSSLSTLTGIPEADLDELYKAEVGGSDDPNYDTTFANTALDPQDAKIVWKGPGTADCATETCILVVKDGKQSPAVYVFDITGWNGTDTINLTGFWPNQGAISNVSIWGGGGSTTVPEPGTLALLGLGLFGMGVMRRRRQ